MEKFFTEGVGTGVTSFYDFPGEDRAMIGDARKTKWVECDTCKAKIERLAGLANRTFTCYDCKRERQRKYRKERWDTKKL